VHAWIWEHLPFGRWGKIIGSFVLVSAVVALLWYVVFPWAEPILPFDDVQVGTEIPGGPGESGGGPADPSSTDDPYRIDYPTHTDNPPPTSR
jgi:hypothetical protein